MSCHWCRGRGCLYCASSDDEAQEILEEGQLRAMTIGAAEIDRIFGATEAEFHQRCAEGKVALLALSQGVVIELGRPAPMKKAEPEAEVCREHLWEFVGGDHLRRRRCGRPGCSAEQRWEWLPEDPKRNGHWVDVFCGAAVVAVAAQGRGRRSRQRPTRARG